MMADQENRDRYGDKMRDAERGKEEDYFARRERELVEKLRKQNDGSLRCPKCGGALVGREDGKATCPLCS